MINLNRLPFLFLMLLSHFSFCQDRTQPFRIGLPEQKISGSLYKTIGWIDAREDSVNMGFVQLGAFNTRALIITKPPFSAQLPDVMRALTDSATGSGELFFQLRKCSFAELTGSFSEKGFFYLRAALYARVDGVYYPVNAIDTLLLVKSMDVTKALLRNAGNLISHFIGSSLLRAPVDSARYSLHELQRPDSAEKAQLKLYTDSSYADGMYKTSRSFFNQQPDGQVKVEMKKGAIKRVEVQDSIGNWTKATPKALYSFVYQGNPYIVTAYGYYPLKKRDNDFYFTGKVKVTADQASQLAAAMMFGLLGSILSANAASYFEMKLDHNNGSFIQIRKIPDAYASGNN